MTRPMSDGVSEEPIVIDASDDQSEIQIDLDRWRDLMSAALSAEGIAGPGEATLTFIDAGEMTELNREHMGVDGPTDVLSFPIDGAEPLSGRVPRMVGDIVICPSVAAANAPAHAGDVDSELALLVVHGVLHLLGHDHAENDGRAVMQERERNLLGELWGPLAADPWAVV